MNRLVQNMARHGTPALVVARRHELMELIIQAEDSLGRKLTDWQFEAALGYLTWNDFMSRGRGAGKKFTADFVQAVLLMEPNEH